MCSPVAFMVTAGIGSVLSAAGTYKDASAQKSALEAQASISRSQSEIAESNSRMAMMQAEESELNAEKEANQKRLATKRLIGEQVAAFGSSGVDVGSGSPLSVYSETSYFGELDAQASIDQGRKNALAYEMDSMNYLNQAGSLRASATGYESQASNTNPWAFLGGSLIGSAASLGSSYWSYTQPSYVANARKARGL